MANGAPTQRKPGALKAIQGGADTGPAPFNADERRAARETSPVTIGGVAFKRSRKDWKISRAMRAAMREQENANALSIRLRGRVAELEAEQVEASSKGETEREDTLEEQIRDLVDKADEATERAELVTYRLLALLLVPPAHAGEDATEDVPGADLAGFGPVEDPNDALPAIEFLQPELDVEDAAELAQELTGSREPDPPATPSPESGSD